MAVEIASLQTNLYIPSTCEPFHISASLSPPVEHTVNILCYDEIFLANIVNIFHIYLDSRGWIQHDVFVAALDVFNPTCQPSYLDNPLFN